MLFMMINFKFGIVLMVCLIIVRCSLGENLCRVSIIRLFGFLYFGKLVKCKMCFNICW